MKGARRERIRRRLTASRPVGQNFPENIHGVYIAKEIVEHGGDVVGQSRTVQFSKECRDLFPSFGP